MIACLARWTDWMTIARCQLKRKETKKNRKCLFKLQIAFVDKCRNELQNERERETERASEKSKSIFIFLLPSSSTFCLKRREDRYFHSFSLSLLLTSHSPIAASGANRKRKKIENILRDMKCHVVLIDTPIPGRGKETTHRHSHARNTYVCRFYDD